MKAAIAITLAGASATATFVLARRIAAYWPFTVDDAFITLRYSRHLAAGLGPVWNEGEPPAEGYTTFLWMLLGAVAHLFRADAVVVMKAASIFFAFLTVASTGAWAYVLHDDAPRAHRALLAVAAASFVALLPSTAVHAVTAMETTLASFLLTTFFVAQTLQLRGSSPRHLVSTAVLGLLAGLTRPEANMAVGVAHAVALTRRINRRRYAGAVLLFHVLPGAIYFAWRLAYYRQPLPLAFYVKTTGARFAGAAELLGFAQWMLLASPIVLIAVLAGIPRAASRMREALTAALAWAAFFTVPAPIMAYEFRYLYPVVPILAVATTAGVVSIARLSSLPWRALAATALVVLPAVEWAKLVPRSVRDWTGYGRGIKVAHERLARDLLLVDPSARSIVALVDVGAVAYRSEWRTIDTFGLNDPTVARGGHDPRLVMSRTPDVVVLLSKRPDAFEPHLAWERALYEESIRAGLSPVTRYTFDPTYHLYVLARGDVAARWPRP